MNNSPYPQLNDEGWLRSAYVTQRRDQADIAKEVGCNARAVERALRRFEIPTERRGWRRYPQLEDRVWLARQIETKTIRQIGSELGCASATVFQATRRLGLEIPERMVKPTPANIEAMQAALRERYPNGRHGADASNWRGGVRRQNGYVFRYAPDHPRASKRGIVQEHILVMEEHLGRYLEPGEIVHHKNHVKDDNRLENLYLTKNGTHIAEHFAEGKRVAEVETENADLKAEVARLKGEA